MFPAVFVVKGMEKGTYSGSVLFSPFNMFGNCLSSLHLCPWIVASGPDVCFGMGGCLDLVVFVTVTLGLPLLGISLAVSLSAVWVLVLRILLLSGPSRIILMLGLMVAGRIPLSGWF